MHFSFCINDDLAVLDLATGFINAADAADALRQLGDARANVYQLWTTPGWSFWAFALFTVFGPFEAGFFGLGNGDRPPRAGIGPRKRSARAPRLQPH